MQRLTAPQMVDRVRYPLDRLEETDGRHIASRCRESFRRSGLCMLTDFVTPDALAVLAAEASAVCDEAYFCSSAHTAYLTDDDSRDAVGSVQRRLEHTYVGSVAYDRIGDRSHLARLYAWEALTDFIGAVVGTSPLYRLGDPLGACSINVFVDGGEHGWHFDESEFAVTLMLQAPESGGAFEYVPQIRGRHDEASIVERVLDGERDQVAELPFTPGALLIFGGRETLHRVTRVSGEKPRLVPVLCYSDRPGATNSDAVRTLFWGRTGREGGVVPAV